MISQNDIGWAYSDMFTQYNTFIGSLALAAAMPPIPTVRKDFDWDFEPRGSFPL
jgi:hypothetical protein